MTDAADTRWLFFALWPDDTTRDALNRTGKWLHQHWGGRRMRADTLHLTLAFLGETPATRVPDLLSRIDRLHAQPFELLLDQPGCWLHKHIGWLGLSQPSAPLSALAEAVRIALRESGVCFDARPFAPHVTLLRNMIGGMPPACVPVRWAVRDFALVDSRPAAGGRRYATIRRWPLA